MHAFPTPHRYYRTAFVAAALAGVLSFPSGSLAGERMQDLTRVDPLSSCLWSCDGPECLRDCVDNEVVSFGRTATRIDAASASIGDCSRASFENVATCTNTFLLPRENENIEGFWVCVAAAADVFLHCPAFQTAPSGSPDQSESLLLGGVLIGFLIDGAEHDVRNARAGVLRLPPRVHEHRSIKSSRQTQGGVAAQPQPEVSRTFADCVKLLDENLGTCDATFPPGSAGSGICHDGAKGVFRVCLGLKAQ